jgi:hypothetical protein
VPVVKSDAEPEDAIEARPPTSATFNVPSEPMALASVDALLIVCPYAEFVPYK